MLGESDARQMRALLMLEADRPVDPRQAITWVQVGQLSGTN